MTVTDALNKIKNFYHATNSTKHTPTPYSFQQSGYFFYLVNEASVTVTV